MFTTACSTWSTTLFPVETTEAIKRKKKKQIENRRDISTVNDRIISIDKTRTNGLPLLRNDEVDHMQL